MKFIADLHVHSHFSRATAKNLDLENLYIAAQLKGIALVGTGDFTHPGWLAEIKTKLIPANDGFLKLRPDIAGQCDLNVPQACQHKVRFVLTTEISNIYFSSVAIFYNLDWLIIPGSNKRLLQGRLMIGEKMCLNLFVISWGALIFWKILENF